MDAQGVVEEALRNRAVREQEEAHSEAEVGDSENVRQDRTGVRVYRLTRTEPESPAELSNRFEYSICHSKRRLRTSRR